jgi:hypothetical protein
MSLCEGAGSRHSIVFTINLSGYRGIFYLSLMLHLFNQRFFYGSLSANVKDASEYPASHITDRTDEGLCTSVRLTSIRRMGSV